MGRTIVAPVALHVVGEADEYTLNRVQSQLVQGSRRRVGVASAAEHTQVLVVWWNTKQQ